MCLHLIQEITRLQQLLNENRIQKEQKLANMSKRLYNLQKKIDKNTPIQTDFKMKRSTTYRGNYGWILRSLRQPSNFEQNFYKSISGKLNTVSFHSVKEKQPS
jgi:hypothetical protein